MGFSVVCLSGSTARMLRVDRQAEPDTPASPFENFYGTQKKKKLSQAGCILRGSLQPYDQHNPKRYGLWLDRKSEPKDGLSAFIE